jgi:hypothetical protein
MALTVTITDPELIALIEQKAGEAGVSESEAVELVLGERRNPTYASQRSGQETALAREERIARALKTLAEIHKVITDEDRAFDYDAWLYDENGLPHRLSTPPL